jgi:8-oxo-dGTP pyrophosphatase MutT (NUDIX family)
VVGVATRRDIRARRLPHRSCYILVFDRAGRLFIHLRTPTKDVYPSHWDVAVGGVLRAGESFEEGAVRELAEELGITTAVHPLLPLVYEDAANVVHGMVFRAVHDGPFVLQVEEVVRGEFVAPEVVQDRAAREPFCPDGLVALARVLRARSSGDRPA